MGMVTMIAAATVGVVVGVLLEEPLKHALETAKAKVATKAVQLKAAKTSRKVQQALKRSG